MNHEDVKKANILLGVHEQTLSRMRMWNESGRYVDLAMSTQPFGATEEERVQIKQLGLALLRKRVEDCEKQLRALGVEVPPRERPAGLYRAK